MLFITIQGPIYNKLQLVTANVESFGIPLQQICYVVAKDGKITEEQKEFIEQIRPIDEIKECFTPCLVDSIKWKGNFDDTFLGEHKIQFLKVWIEIFIQNPKDYIVEYLFNTLGYWNINRITDSAYIQYKNHANEQPFAGVTQIDFIKEATGNSISEELEKVNLISEAFWVWSMFLSIIITIKNKRYKNLIIYIPALLTWGTIMIATPVAFTLRYVYILVLLFPLNFIIPFLSKEGE